MTARKAAAAGVALVCLVTARAARGGEELPAGITPEQVAYLEESLGEGLGTADGKLVDMALEGLKATGKDAGALARSLERAALSAALSYPNFNERVRIDAWTLAARAKLGDASAADTLAEWTGPAAPPPVGEARFDPRASTRARVTASRSVEALTCLAYLKVEGVKDLAEEILRREAEAVAGDPRRRMPYGYDSAGRVKAAMQILLEADREAGSRLVFALIEDEGLSADHRVRLLGACAEILQGDGDALDGLASAFRSLVDAIIAKGFDERRPDPSMMALLGVATRWLPGNEKVLAGLEALEEALPAQMKRWVSSRVQSYRRRMGLPDKTRPGVEEARPKAPPPRETPGRPPTPAPAPAPAGGEAQF